MPSVRFIGSIILVSGRLILLAQTTAVYQPSGISASHSISRSALTNQVDILEGYGKLPLSFEVNQGQTDAQVKFLARADGYTLFLTGDGAVFLLRGDKAIGDGSREFKPAAFPTTPNVLRMKLEGANPAVKVISADEVAGKSNYFIGNDPKKWSTNVANYAKVKYESIYPGIDLIYYGNQRQLEYDFVVAVGADPSLIHFDVVGAQRILPDDRGDLVLQTDAGELRWRKPVVYQERNGVRREVDGRYVIQRDRIRFEVAGYDSKLPLTIDPTLVYSTYLGGSGSDTGMHVAVDSAGNAYVSGETFSTDFPTQNPLQTTSHGGGDAFVAKLNPSGSALVYSTYLGGSGEDYARAIALDSSNNAYVTGFTQSGDFPTLNALQPSYGGGFSDNFVAKLDATGSHLVFSTYLGGSALEQGLGIAVDSAGSAYVVGETESQDYPAVNPLRACFATFGERDGFVSKLSPAGNSLIYSTCLGGTGEDQALGIAVDSAGDAYVGGDTYSSDFPVTATAFQSLRNGPQDGFVSELNPAGNGLIYSTYLGGSSSEGVMGLALDPSNNVYVNGSTASTDFPVTSGTVQGTYGGGASDSFVSKLNTSRSGAASLVYSTYLGSSGDDYGLGIAADASGDAYLTGSTTSLNFPLVNSLQPAYGGGASDAFVTELNPQATSAIYSSYLGGNGAEDAGPWGNIAIDSIGNVYVVGVTSSANFPTNNGAFQVALNGLTDAFVTKIGLGGLPFLSFPLHGMSRGINQHLTPQTAQINTVFDHTMLGSTGHFSVYGCDSQVEDFAGEIGNTNPSKFHLSCRHGYENAQTGYKFLQNIANYSGNPYLFYDGHPGYDFQSTFGNQVYAAVSGIVSYPTQAQLNAAGIFVGGNPDIFNVMELDPGNGYKIFHLHLSTHTRNIATQQPLTADLTGQNFLATKTGTTGAMTPGTLPTYTPLAISGQVTLNGQPLPGVQVNVNSTIAVGNGACTASTKTDVNGNYMFVGLKSGYHYNIYVSPTGGYTFAAQNPVYEVPDGAHVNTGALIALSGNAGPCVPGHLHFEVQRKTGSPVTMYSSSTQTMQLNYIPVDPYGWSPTTQGVQDPYTLIPELQNAGVTNMYIWK